MADHKHGEMDTTVQEKTFEGFIKMTVWSVVGIAVFLIFLAMVGAVGSFSNSVITMWDTVTETSRDAVERS